jgi:ubiquinone/menaquinone biosynthesis C-methylase UbiE
VARIDYDAVAAHYTRGRGLTEDGLTGWREAVRPYLEGLAHPLVDIGSGTGQFATLFPRWFGLDVVGVEPSGAMRAVAIDDTRDPRVTYLEGDAEHLPLADEACGAAWLSTVIHHIPDLEAAAREVRRVVVPGGPVLIRSAFPGRTARITLFRFFPEAAGVVETFPSIEQVERDFRGAGFRLEKVEAIPQVSVASLAEFRERVVLRADTTLRGISDEAFAAGLARLDDTISGGEDTGPLVDYLDLVVLR